MDLNVNVLIQVFDKLKYTYRIKRVSIAEGSTGDESFS